MPGDDLKRLAAEIRGALTAKDWSRGAQLLERWCGLLPEHGPGWHRRAGCLVRLQRPAEALNCARRAAAIEPDNEAFASLVDSLEHRLESAAGKTQAEDPEVAPSRPIGPPATEVAAQDPPTPPTSVPATEVAAQEPRDPVPATEAAETPKPAPPTPESALWQEGTVVDGRYDVRGVARGGMGEVYFVTDRELGIQVAVKTPLPWVLATESGRGRFLREAEAWIALGLHPNICTAYYVRRVGGLPRLFIEYLEGGDLVGWMKTHPDVELARDIDLAIQIASGMHHAHTFSWTDEDGRNRIGVVHRDLKPANILIAADGAAKVTDFGLVGRGLAASSAPPPEISDNAETRALNPSDQVWGTLTMGGVVMGTPPYMPPEQWRGAHAAGAPADIYAFGCILYELLCRRRPFALDPELHRARPELQLMEWQKLHREGKPPDPQSLNGSLDDDLSSLMTQCLRPSPGDRPASFEEIRTRLIAAHERLTGSVHHRPQPEATRLLADSWNNRGVSFATLGQVERAHDAWQSALDADPHHIEASFNLSLSMWRRGLATDAEIDARMAEIRASQTATWRDEHLGGRLALCLGHTRQALTDLRGAFNASGGTPQVARDFALALAAAASNDNDEALWKESATVLSTHCGALSSDPAVLATYALAMQRLGRSQEAGRLYAAARRHSDVLSAELEQGAEGVLPGIQRRRRLPGTVGRILKTTAVPDGRIGAAMTDNGKINVWDLRSGDAVRSLQPAGGRSRVLAMDPAGQSLMTSAENEAVAIWDLGSGVVSHRLQSHAGMLNHLIVTSDGRRALGVGTAGKLHVWNLVDRKLVGSFAGHSAFATCIAAAADGITALSGGAQGELVLWNLSDGEPSQQLVLHETTVSAVAVSRGARTAASGCEDGVVAIWDLVRGQCSRTLRGHDGPITYVGLSDDGRRCLSGSKDGTLRLWDLDLGEPTAVRRLDGGVTSAASDDDWQHVLLGHGTEVSVCTAPKAGGFRPGWAVATPITVGQAVERAGEFHGLLETARRRLADKDLPGALEAVETARAIPGYERSQDAVDLDERIAEGMPITALRSGWEETVLNGHTERILALAKSPNGHRLVTAGTDNRVVWWTMEDRAEETSIQVRRAITSLVSIPDGGRALGGDLDGVINELDPGAGGCRPVLTGHEARIHAIACSGDGRSVLSASADQTARWWHRSSGRCLRILEGHTGEVRSAAVSPAGMIGATGGDDGSLVVWDLETGAAMRGLDGHTGPITDLAWSGDGRLLVSAGADGTIRNWEAATGSCLGTFDPSEPVAAISISPDGAWCAGGCRSGGIQLWRLGSREPVRTFKGHSGAVSALVFSPDGRRLCSTGEDGSLRIWYLDWQINIKTAVDWDRSAEPYLQIFLDRFGDPTGDQRPRWSDEDVRSLIVELRHRGFGWIRPAGVARELRRMADERASATARPADRKRQPRPLPAATPKQRSAQRRKVRLAAAVLAAAVPAVLLLGHLRSRSQIDYHDLALANARREVFEATASIPPALVDGVSCSRERADDYLRIYLTATEPEASYQAQHCLSVIGDPDTVGPLLDLYRPVPALDPNGATQQDIIRFRREQARRRGSAQEVFSVLARMDDDSVSAIARAVTDADPRVRSTAASVLAFRNSEAAAEALLAHSRHPDARVRSSVAKNLRILLSSGVVPRGEALVLLERLANDPNDEVRRGAADALTLYEGSAVDELARRLAVDLDENISEAAKAVLRR